VLLDLRVTSSGAPRRGPYSVIARNSVFGPWPFRGLFTKTVVCPRFFSVPGFSLPVFLPGFSLRRPSSVGPRLGAFRPTPRPRSYRHRSSFIAQRLRSNRSRIVRAQRRFNNRVHHSVRPADALRLSALRGRSPLLCEILAESRRLGAARVRRLETGSAYCAFAAAGKELGRGDRPEGAAATRVLARFA